MGTSNVDFYDLRGIIDVWPMVKMLGVFSTADSLSDHFGLPL